MKIINGGTSRQERTQAINDYKHEDRIMCITYNLCVGHTLNETQIIIHLESTFKPSDEVQASARACRASAPHGSSLLSIRLVSGHTIDNLVYEKTKSKANLINSLLDNEDTSTR